MNVKKILILDDEEMIRLLLKKLFERKGYDVVEASDAEQAYNILNKEFIHIMFFDLMLPGMNGLDLCKMIKKQNPIAVIYAMTGYTSVFELASCREAGFDDYFVKPLKLDVMLKAAEDGVEKISRWMRLKV